MIAYRKNLESYCENKKDIFDNRKHFAEANFSYFTENGIEYRRKFQAKILTPENEFWNIAPKEIEVKI